jgi:predicted amidohydrolase YtcJ
MPGFVEPHSHIVMQSAKFSTANLDPKPIGEAGTIADIQRILREWIEEKKPEPGKWIIGWGYDDTGIAEQRHPNRDDLDAVSTDCPMLLMHISSHLMTGKLEDLGGLSEDPLAVDPMKIKDIQVLETVKEGESIYQATS